jgi:glyoxalase/bleomycin resistance protein/dioxygenase superfamily protein
MRPERRWVEVKPPGARTTLTLVTWFETMPPGSLKGLVLAVDDVQAAHDELSAKRVEFFLPPEERPWGTRRCCRILMGTG